MFNLYTQARGATINPTIHKIILQSPTSPPKSLNHRSKSMAPCCVETAIRENNHNPDRHTGNNLHLNPNSRNYKDFSSCPQSVRQNASIAPVCPNGPKPVEIPVFFHDSFPKDDIWSQMVNEAQIDVKQEPILSSYYTKSILCHNSLESALAYHLSSKLGSPNLPSTSLVDLFLGVLIQDQEIIEAVEEDLRAVKERDPACISYVHCFLNFKGFSACQAHRIAHSLWIEGRKIMALLIQNRVSEVFSVDIHPGAKIGRGILLDHATGLVIGETAVIGNNVSILHNVTLGGTGKAHGDRHPKIGDGVLIGAGTCVLGTVKIGDGAKVGAGSVVLKEVPDKTTAVGNPARLIGGKENPVFCSVHMAKASPPAVESTVVERNLTTYEDTTVVESRSIQPIVTPSHVSSVVVLEGEVTTAITIEDSKVVIEESKKPLDIMLEIAETPITSSLVTVVSVASPKNLMKDATGKVETRSWSDVLGGVKAYTVS